MDILEFHSELEKDGNIKTFVIQDHDDPMIQNNESKSTLNIMHLNIRSINKNMDNLMVLLESLKTEFHIIILSETWRINCTDNFNIKDYNIFYSEGNYNQNDGLVIYVKDKITVTNFKYTKFTENTFANFTFQIEDLFFNITSVYRLPSTNERQFLLELQQTLASNNNKNIIYLLIGDINIDILNNKPDMLRDEYLNITVQNGFLSYINQITRPASTTCLDHIFIKTPNNIKNIKFLPIILQNDTTDHYPVLLKVINNTKGNNSNNIPQITSQINFEILKEIISSESWDELYQIDNVNVAFDVFRNKLVQCIQKSTKTTKIKSSEKKIKPWITRGLIISIRNRDKLKLVVNKNRNNLILVQEYKRYRNKTNDLLKKTKKEFYCKKIAENKNNIRKLWEIIKEGLNENTNNNQKISLVHENQSIIDETQIAEIYNDYFINIGKNMADKIKVEKKLKDRQIHCKNLFLKPTSEDEILKNIKNLKNNSASGYDKISVKTLKETATYITKPLNYIFNLCFEKGIFPSDFKVSTVTPVHKKGDRTVVGNYRPISVISNLGKVLEMCMKSRLVEHLKYNKLLSKYQFGFQDKISTEDAIYEVTKTLYDSIEKNKKQIAIFLDLAKAFDTVSHSILIDKLDNYGVKGVPNDLFASYLNFRKQCVKIGNQKSSLKEINFGIPQGTVLGPILFIIYVNEMLFLNIKGKIISYADDTVLLVDGDSWQNVIGRAEVEFAKLQQWLSENLLTVNIDKTKFICFSIYDKNTSNINNLKLHTYNCLSNNKLNCECSDELKITDSIKYLGVVIDKNLKWTEQISNINTKIRKLIYKFYHLRNIMPNYVLKTLYYALAESIIRYGITIWGGTYPTNLETLKISQKYLIKVILNKNKQYPSEQLFEEFQVFDISLLYVKSVLLFTYKNKSLLNTTVDHDYSTRSKINLNVNIPQISRTTIQRSIMYYGPKFYNILPITLKKINNAKLFSKKISAFIKDNKFNFIRVLINAYK